MIRAELDALPVPEKTGLTYASHVTTKDDQGAVVPVMHACGHDLHMAIGIATATLLAPSKDRWPYDSRMADHRRSRERPARSCGHYGGLHSRRHQTQHYS